MPFPAINAGRCSIRLHQPGPKGDIPGSIHAVKTDAVGIILFIHLFNGTHAKDGVNLKPCDRHAIYNSFAEGGVDGFSAGDYMKELPLGQGNVDFPAYIAALAAIDYRGYLTVEREVREDPRADIEMAVGFLKELTASYQI